MNVTNTAQTLSLNPNKFKILTNRQITSVDKVFGDELNMYVSGDLLTIDTSREISGIKVYDLNGILRKENGNQKSISISNLARGCYIVSVGTDSGNIIKKFVKSR
jgi:hypothetical protein